MKKLVFVLVVIFVLRFEFFSQSPVLKNFTIKDGLPSNELYHVYQDSNGFIWISSDAGLIKYDANTFKVFTVSDGMPDNTVFETKEDSKGRLWFRTYTGGIGYVKNDIVHAVAANKLITDMQGPGLINSINIDEKGNVYLGFLLLDDITFMKMSPPYQKGNVEVIKGGTKDNWMDIRMISVNECSFSDRRLQAGSGAKRTVAFYDVYNNLKKVDTIGDMDLSSPLTSVYCRNKRIALVNTKDIKMYDSETGEVFSQKMKNNGIYVYISEAGNLWVSHRDKGLEEYDNKLQKKGSVILNGSSVSCVLEDKNGGVWYATLKEGLFYSSQRNHTKQSLSKATKKTAHLIQKLSADKYIVCFEQGGAAIYYKNEKGIAFGYNIELKNFDRLKIPMVEVVDTETVAISHDDGLLLYNHRFNKVMQSNRFTGLKKYQDKFILLNVNNIFTFNKNTIEHCTFLKGRATSFVWDDKTDKAYVGTTHGLYRYYEQDSIREKDCIHSFRVKDLCSLNGKIYIATKGYGLVVLEKGLSDTISMSKGLASDICEKVRVSGNVCWISSNFGLSRITYRGYKNYEIMNYTHADLGTESPILDFQIDGNMLYFTSDSSLYSIKVTESVKKVIPFYIYSVEINDLISKNKQTFDLAPDERKVKINFGVLEYNGNIAYRYRLLPADTNWNYTRVNSILFPSLASGTYSLIIQARCNGQWINCPQRLQFRIERPLWQKSWFVICFLVVSIMIISLLAWFIYKWKIKKERTKNELALRFFNLEIKSMKAQMNPHFMFNALNSIQQLILSNENENAYRYFTKFSKLLRVLVESNTQETISLHDEIELLKRYLEIESLRFKDSFCYEIIVEDKVAVTKHIPHMMIQPFVENSIWHGLLTKKGERKVSIRFIYKSENQLECRIDDNGIGMNAAKLLQNIDNGRKKSIALNSVAERLALFSVMQKRKFGFTITDKAENETGDSGTLVVINLPFLFSVEQTLETNRF